MVEQKRAVRLFGQMISVPAEAFVPQVTVDEGGDNGGRGGRQEDEEHMEVSNHKAPREMSEYPDKSDPTPASLAITTENREPPAQEEEEEGGGGGEVHDSCKMARCDGKMDEEKQQQQQQEEEEEEQKGGASKWQEKGLNIKAQLACPRCSSHDTKFCYFNNYNVKQPRHFCRNCQRYWTAGGTMRNVPVGAGRRKNKSHNNSNSNSHHQYGHLTIISADVPEQLRLREPSAPPLPSGQGYLPPPDGSPWLYGWNPVALPFCDSTFPASSFRPVSPYWGCAAVTVPPPGALSATWLSSSSSPPPSVGPPSTDAPTPPLRKHSRDGTVILKQTNSDIKCHHSGDADDDLGRRLWIPKSLRIDSPEEAAKSSIWTTIGIRKDKSGMISEGGLIFNAFQSKQEEAKNNQTAEASSVILSANPAALSRSLQFREIL